MCSWKIMAEYCNHLKELLAAQIPFFKEEVNFNRFILNRENKGKDVGEAKAKGDYIKKHMKDWGTGFAEVYCLLFCEERSDCKAYSSKQSKLKKKIEDYQKELSNNLHREVSYEEAERKYLYVLTPSYWMGVTEAFLFMKQYLRPSQKRSD